MANKTLIAAAGEHYVAYALSCLGFTAALVRQGAPSIDILASTLDGGRTIGIQVKTTEWAERTRGRGEEKNHLSFSFRLDIALSNRLRPIQSSVSLTYEV